MGGRDRVAGKIERLVWGDVKGWLSNVWKAMGGGRRRVLGRVVSASPLASYLAVAIYAASGGFQAESSGWSVLAVGFAAASAALIVGALVGFLFGLPRVLEKTNPDGFSRLTRT
jgi:hypothetical protein